LALRLLEQGQVRIDELFFWIAWLGRMLKGYVASSFLLKGRTIKNRGELRERQ